MRIFRVNFSVRDFLSNIPFFRSLKNDSVTESHFGVYALIRQNGRVLCVNKTRGPYRGLLDFPGGTPELSESWTETLLRELEEEIGTKNVTIGEFFPYSVHVRRSSMGERINFHHHGVVAEVILQEELNSHADVSADTAGWVWCDLHSQRKMLSSFARHVIDVGRLI